LHACIALTPFVESGLTYTVLSANLGCSLTGLKFFENFEICSGVNCFFFIYNSLKLVAIFLLLNCPTFRGAYSEGDEDEDDWEEDEY
jgi:hypothetical protein